MKKILILVCCILFFNCEKKQVGRVFFAEPLMGAEVKSPVKFKMIVEGFEVQPAGEIQAGKGHHHIIINGETYAEGKPVPFLEKKTFHFGKGQTEAEIELAPGEYSITLQFANGAHISYGKELSSTISIKVVE
jgi:hypothetical protein